jgi:hypothetical protein
MHAAVMQLDADAAAQQWVQYLSETMQLLVLAELEPTTAEPLLQTHMQRTLAWLLCLYYFNTSGEALRSVLESRAELSGA